MAKCDEGYNCSVCNQYVESITDSTLYLRYIIGDIPSSVLMSMPEQHIRCDPATAQYIMDDSFPPVVCDDAFDKREFDADYVGMREDLVTRGWQRLQHVKEMKIPISEYPLNDEANGL